MEKRREREKKITECHTSPIDFNSLNRKLAIVLWPELLFNIRLTPVHRSFRLTEYLFSLFSLMLKQFLGTHFARTHVARTACFKRFGKPMGVIVPGICLLDPLLPHQHKQRFSGAQRMHIAWPKISTIVATKFCLQYLKAVHALCSDQ